jgi:hypothetical protein
MNIIINEKLVNRNRRIAQIASFGGLAVLIGGMIISFTREELVNYSFTALILGFILSQFGMYYMNRWGRRPRPDELLNQALKGFDSKYTIYHYSTAVSHLLVGPAGIWVIIPKYQQGRITFENGRWRQRGGGFLQVYMRVFAQEGLGRPDIEISTEIEAIKRYFKKKGVGDELPEIQALLVFTHAKADLVLDEENPPTYPTLALGKLKEHLRKTAKSKPISQDRLFALQEQINA